ncbi:MAG: porin [Hyphomicrobiales bacterium]
MTLAKRLLLGTAAAFVATSGAHAADLGLPVAPSVDYVQICSIGSFTGFILPGGDVCFDISGFARFEANLGVANPYGATNGYDDVDFNAEVGVNFDARTMTEWGLLRGFVGLGEAGAGEDFALTVEKGFVQIGGLTAGLTDSFFDPVYTDYAMAAIGAPDGGTDDLTLIGYNYGVGNGVTLSISLEDNGGNGRMGGISLVNAGAAASLTGAAIALNVAQGNFQDADNALAAVVGVRVDQAWGSAKLAGALTTVDVDDTLIPAVATGTVTDQSEIGYAIQASATFNLPVGVGSNFGLFGIYTDGAISYMGAGGFATGGATGATGTDIGLDAIIDGATGNLQTTQAWALGAGLEFGLNNMTDLEFDAYYADVDHGAALGAVGDYNVWAIRSSLAYRPVSGLEIRAGVGYTDYDVNVALAPFFDSGFTGRFRITRSF